MRKLTRIPSNYGPVDIELVLCDNSDCQSVAQEQYTVNWFHVSTLGVEAPTMGGYLADTDYCSIKCLVEDTKTYTE